MIIMTNEVGAFLAPMTLNAGDRLGRHHGVDHMLLIGRNSTTGTGTETDFLESVVSTVVVIAEALIRRRYHHHQRRRWPTPAAASRPDWVVQHLKRQMVSGMMMIDLEVLTTRAVTIVTGSLHFHQTVIADLPPKKFADGIWTQGTLQI